MRIDEVSSIIIDLGNRYLRMGYSGDDRPSLVVPSAVGITQQGTLLFGDLDLYHPRDGMEIREVSVEDIERLAALLAYGMRLLGAEWKDHPVLFVDDPLWKAGTREQLSDLLFNKFHIPALYFGRSPVLAAFSHGRHSALVVDMGASGIRVAPVHDGLLDKNGCVNETFIGGVSLTAQTRMMLEEEKTPLHIRQMVEQRSMVGLGKPPVVDVKMLPVHESFIEYHLNLLVDDFKITMAQISELTTYDKGDLEMRPIKFYEFPNGFNQSYGLERYRLGELLFHPSKHRFDQPKEEVSPSPPMGLAELIKRCLGQVDVDIRKDVLSNIVITGGASSFSGLAERLAKELGSNCRVHLGATSQERRFGAWIGGSIVASLASFQTLWISQQEYKEKGPSCIAKCP